jgi:NADH-quinone oxidoreductase subunit L
MSYSVLALLLILFPATGFALLSLGGKRMKPYYSGIIACTLIFLSAFFSLYLAYGYFFNFGNIEGRYVQQIAFHYNWLPLNENLNVEMGFSLNPVSTMMLVVITLISAMVHLYSFAYMKDEERYSTYFAYLSLFTFSMLGLVVSMNLIQLYIFWELVGISSFLLIGFYFTRPSAIAAAKKAFIITRFADAGFLIGILILGIGTQTLNIQTMIERLTDPSSGYFVNMTGNTFMGLSILTWSLLLVFIGGAGKSAMFPLHIWLPDAMEGPTPVSALIHAATMVVAGVFLVARFFPVYAIAVPDLLALISYIGVFSALLAAIIACSQTDIKRILAYSTISQIGFMMFGLGVARWGIDSAEGYTASIFHLFTHAFFKALLFLGAGIIIHTTHNNDMASMGGMRKLLPVTHFTFFIACFAIAGIPPFSGFFSKEALLSAAYDGNIIVYSIAVITSGLTSFYMFRLYFTVFWGKDKPSPSINQKHPKENWIMSIPLIILAFGAAFSGFVPIGKFLSPDGSTTNLSVHFLFSIFPIVVSILGISIAYKMYFVENDLPEKAAITLGKAYVFVKQKFYVDEMVLFITHKIIFKLIGQPVAWFDRNMIDKSINSIANITAAIAVSIKRFQSGRLQTYTLFFLGGILLMALILIWHFKL